MFNSHFAIAWCINTLRPTNIPKAKATVRKCSAQKTRGLTLTVFPVVFQACSLEVHTVNPAQDFVHGSVYGPPLAGLQAWQRRVFVDEAWAVLHHVEGCAKDPGRDTYRVFHDSQGGKLLVTALLFLSCGHAVSAGERFGPRVLDISFFPCT